MTTFERTEQPTINIELAFGEDWRGFDPATAVWTSVWERLRSIKTKTGRSSDLNKFQAGTGDVLLDNRDGELLPDYPPSQWYPDIVPQTPVRIRAQTYKQRALDLAPTFYWPMTASWAISSDRIDNQAAARQSWLADIVGGNPLEPNGADPDYFTTSSGTVFAAVYENFSADRGDWSENCIRVNNDTQGPGGAAAQRRPAAGLGDTDHWSVCGYIRRWNGQVGNDMAIMNASIPGRDLWKLRLLGATNLARFILVHEDGTSTVIESTTTFPANDPHHIAVTYDATESPNGTLRLYVDGVLESTVEITNTSGARTNDNGQRLQMFTENVDQFPADCHAQHWGLWEDYTLSAADVASLFNAGDRARDVLTGFVKSWGPKWGPGRDATVELDCVDALKTPGVSQFPALYDEEIRNGDPSHYWRQDEPQRGNVDPTIGIYPLKKGSSFSGWSDIVEDSPIFDGRWSWFGGVGGSGTSGGFGLVARSGGLEGTGNATWEVWFRVPNYGTLSQPAIILAQEPDSGSYDFQVICSGTGEVFALINEASVLLLQTATQYDDDVWHHLALTKTGTTWRLFVDAIQQDSGTKSFTMGGDQIHTLVARGGGAGDWIYTSHIALYERALGSTELQDHINAAQGGLDDTIDERLSRFLDAYAVPAGLRSLDPDDLVLEGIEKTDKALRAMQDSAGAAFGNFYIGKGGEWTYHHSARRPSSTTQTAMSMLSATCLRLNETPVAGVGLTPSTDYWFGADGTRVGNPTLDTDDVPVRGIPDAGCWDLDGSDGAYVFPLFKQSPVLAAYNSLFNNGDTFFAGAFCKPSSAGAGTDSVLSVTDGTARRTQILYSHNDQRFYYYAGGTSFFIDVPAPPDRWYHVGIGRPGGSGTMDLYLNGARANVGVGSWVDLDSNCYLRVGYRYNGSNVEFFRGRIADAFLTTFQWGDAAQFFAGCAGQLTEQSKRFAGPASSKPRQTPVRTGEPTFDDFRLRNTFKVGTLELVTSQANVDRNGQRDVDLTKTPVLSQLGTYWMRLFGQIYDKFSVPRWRVPKVQTSAQLAGRGGFGRVMDLDLDDRVLLDATPSGSPKEFEQAAYVDEIEHEITRDLWRTTVASSL